MPRWAEPRGTQYSIVVVVVKHYASVGGATRHTVVVVSFCHSVSQSVSHSVATISRSSLKTNR